MSILIKGIDLPKEGEDITLEINHEGEVRAYSTERKETDIEAQAIQIDRPHGRLIDGDEVMKQLQADKREAFTKHDVWLMLSKYGAPTILEAEE